MQSSEYLGHMEDIMSGRKFGLLARSHLTLGVALYVPNVLDRLSSPSGVSTNG